MGWIPPKGKRKRKKRMRRPRPRGRVYLFRPKRGFKKIHHSFPRTRIRSAKHVPIQCGKYYIQGPVNVWNDAGIAVYDPAAYSRPYQYEHMTRDYLNPGPPYRVGRGFRLFRYTDDLHVAGNGEYYSDSIPSLAMYKYVGGFVPMIGPGSIDGEITSSLLHDEATAAQSLYPEYGDAQNYGATGWNRFRPGRSTASLAQFFGELKDMPRTLQTTAGAFARKWRSAGGGRRGFGPPSVANHWLNTQFGWLPFIGDLRRFWRSCETLQERLARIVRENNHWVTRKGTIETDTTLDEVGGSSTVCGCFPTLVTPMYASPSSSGSHVLFRRKETRIWFVGRFKYYIPELETAVGTSAWYGRATDELFGARPNPSLIWELTPWSWLADWFGNVGDVIGNLDTGWAENLVAAYAYVMRSTFLDLTVDSTINLKNGPVHGTWNYPLEWKSRAVASPFGFGLSSSTFSARQWSLLAALGVSRKGLF